MVADLREQMIFHDRFQSVFSELQEVLRRANTGHQILLPIVGPSRTGKTAIIQAFCKDHVGGCDLKRPILNVTSPKNNTARALIDACLLSIGMSPRMYTNQVEANNAFLRSLHRLETKIIIFDETQHMLERSGHRTIRGAGDFFKDLYDQSKVSLVLAGLPSLEGLFSANEQLKNRSQASVELFPYCWHGESYKGFRKALGSALQFMEEHSWETFKWNDKEFADRMYVATAGRYGMVHKIFMEVLTDFANSKQAGYEEFNRAYHACIRPEGIDFSPFDIAKLIETEHMALVYSQVMRDAGVSTKRLAC
jgi:hypothetical protein